MVRIIENVTINDPRRVSEIPLSNSLLRSRLLGCHATLGGALRESQSEPSEILCISYGACEDETGTDLWYEVKQI